MESYYWGLFIFIGLTVFSCNHTAKETPGQTPKIVFIVIDGIPADMILQVKTPGIDSISHAGGFTKAFVGGKKGGYSESPTISAVGYNSLLTGTWANKHNVWNNDVKEPNYHYWILFRLVEELAPEKKTAIFSSWTDNRTKLIGVGKDSTNNLRLDYYFDGFDRDTVAYPHDEEGEYIRMIDNHVAKEAAEYIEELGPDLSWVYLWYPDHVAHQYGDSPEFRQAIKHADQQVQAIWQAVQKRMDREEEDWLIVVTTDHGRDNQTGKGHGGQSPRERSIWIATNASELNNYFENNEPGIVDIYPTVSRFMDLEIPVEQQRELDGIPLIGPVSVKNIRTEYEKETHKLYVEWDPVNPEGYLQMRISKTNNFKTGGSDYYQVMKTIPVKAGSASLKVGGSSYYKIVLEAPHNTLNSWVIVD